MGTRLQIPYHHVRSIAQPAVSTEFTITAPGNEVWRIASLSFTLTTDATVATRAVTLVADDGTTRFFQAGPQIGVTATQAVRFGAIPGSDATTSSQIALIALPNPYGIYLQPGWRLRSLTTNIQAGDQYSAIGALVEAFPLGPDVEWEPTVNHLMYERG